MLYEEIIQSMKKEIHSGKLVTGSKLPSLRKMATDFSCSKNTIIKAFSELEKEHLIYSIPKKGYFVVNNPISNNKFIKVIDFLAPSPANNALSMDDFKHCVNQTVETYASELTSYSEQEGFLPLRRQVLKYLQNHQVFTSLDRLFITSGSQQALDILISMPFPNGRQNILVEQPTYFGFIHSAQLSNTKVFGIDVTKDSFDLNRLEYIFKNNEIKFFYLVTRFQNPLGHSYTNKEKQAIVQLANKYDVYILEDDYLGDLDVNSKADPCFSYDPSGRVIYLKSFSKIFLPGLRLAALVLPDLMRSAFLEYKFCRDFCTSSISQGILAIYMENGMFNNHLNNIKELYIKKMQTAITACEEFLPDDVEFTKPASGFYFSIFLPDYISANRLVLDLQQQNILIDNADRMYLPEYRKNNLIRLSISQMKEEYIREGIQLIAEEIRNLKNVQNPFLIGTKKYDGRNTI